MTGRQGTPRSPPSTFIELRPRTRHTISGPPLSLANTVSDFPKAIVTPKVPLPQVYAPIPQTHAPPPRPQTPTQRASAITAIRTIQKSSDPSFICTICWSPQHPPSIPRVLGRSSRIVCLQCWRAVLDLSICWVCGECIVRGDDVVSLGWCFWHRGCFGCLLCGVRLGERVLMDCESESQKEVGEAGEDGYGGGRKGMELDKIPLCGWCETDTKSKGYGEKKVLERGLENVTKSDGGLTRCRLEKLDEDNGVGGGLNLSGKKDVVVGLDGEEMIPDSPSSSSSISPMSMKKSRRSTLANERKIRKLIRDSSTPQEEIALLSDAAKMGISEDGNPDDDTHFHSDTEPANFSQVDSSKLSSLSNSSPSSPSNIYVSIYDPVGRAFVPSKTKPLPKWMSLLPNSVHREREDSHGDFSQQKAGAAVSRATLPEAYADGASSNHSEDCPRGHGPLTPCPMEEGSPVMASSVVSGEVTPRDQPDRSNSASDSISISTRQPSVSTLASLNIPSPQRKGPQTTRPRSVSIEEKLPCPHQHHASVYCRANRSSTMETVSIQPGGLVKVIQSPDHPPRDVSERPLTPYPKGDDPFQTILGSSNTHRRPSGPSLLTSPLSNFITPRKGSCCGLSTSLETVTVGELKRRDRGESTFDSTFESFPKPEIGTTSPKLGFLVQSSEYLEKLILPSGGGKEEKEGIVEKIKRQRVGTVSLGQLAQNVKEEKERKRAETLSQTEGTCSESELKPQNGEEGNMQSANLQIGSRVNSKRAREREVSREERGQLSMDGSRRSLRGKGGREGREGSGQSSRAGSRKGKERERKKQERMDIKGKGKEIMVEEESEHRVGSRVDVGESREKLKWELKGLFGEE